MHVVICGGGFGGLVAAKKLAGRCEATLIDKKPAFEYLPSLPFIVSGKKQRIDITINYNQFAFRHSINFVQDRVISIDPDGKTVACEKQQVKFDKCIVSLGSTTNFFGIPNIDSNALVLKDIDDAEKIRTTIESVMDKNNGAIAVCGGGLTGIELATEIKDLVGRLAKRSRKADMPKILLVEALPEIMPGFPENAIVYARKILEKEKVQVLANSPIVNYDGITLSLKDGREVQADVVIWVAGVKPNPILKESSMPLQERGTVSVNQYLQTGVSSDIYAIGDLVAILNPATQKPFPWTAQYAEQQAEIAAYNILHEKEPKQYDPKASNDMLVSIGNEGLYLRKGKIVKGKLPLVLKNLLERWWLFRHR